MERYGLNGGVKRHDVEDGRRYNVEEDTAADVLTEVVGGAFVLAAVAHRGFFDTQIVRRIAAHILRQHLHLFFVCKKFKKKMVSIYCK